MKDTFSEDIKNNLWIVPKLSQITISSDFSALTVDGEKDPIEITTQDTYTQHNFKEGKYDSFHFCRRWDVSNLEYCVYFILYDDGKCFYYKNQQIIDLITECKKITKYGLINFI